MQAVRTETYGWILNQHPLCLQQIGNSNSRDGQRLSAPDDTAARSGETPAGQPLEQEGGQQRKVVLQRKESQLRNNAADAHHVHQCREPTTNHLAAAAVVPAAITGPAASAATVER